MTTTSFETFHYNNFILNPESAKTNSDQNTDLNTEQKTENVLDVFLKIKKILCIVYHILHIKKVF